MGPRRRRDSTRQAGIRGRRAARKHLAETTVELAAARSAFEPINAIWQPLRNAAENERRSYEPLRDTHGIQGRADEHRQLPDRHQGLADRIEALDHWRGWATGRTITMETATLAVEVLDAANNPHYSALADTVCKVTPELIAEPEPPAIEHGYEYPEVDFGIDL